MIPPTNEIRVCIKCKVYFSKVDKKKKNKKKNKKLYRILNATPNAQQNS